MCVKECPKVRSPHVDLYTLITYSGLYNPQLPIDDINETEIINILENDVEIADYSHSSSFVNTTCNINKCFPMYNPITSWSSAGINEGYGYAFYIVDSKPYMNRCIVSEDALEFMYDFTNSDEETRSKGSSESQKQNGWLSSVTSDVYFTRNYIFGFGLGFSVVSFILYLSQFWYKCDLKPVLKSVFTINLCFKCYRLWGLHIPFFCNFQDFL